MTVRVSRLQSISCNSAPALLKGMIPAPVTGSWKTKPGCGGGEDPKHDLQKTTQFIKTINTRTHMSEAKTTEHRRLIILKKTGAKMTRLDRQAELSGPTVGQDPVPPFL